MYIIFLKDRPTPIPYFLLILPNLYLHLMFYSFFASPQKEKFVHVVW